MNNSRRYSVEKFVTRQSGMTTVTYSEIVYPTLIDSFSGTSFSYSAITTNQLSYMSDVDYSLRLNDYLTTLVGIDLQSINTLTLLASYYDPACTNPVYLTDISVSCVYPPPITGGSLFTIQSNFNAIDSYNIYTNVDGVITEDNKRVYDISLLPLPTGQTFTINYNYELAVSIIGSNSNYVSTVRIIKNSVEINSFTATSATTEVNGTLSFTYTNTDTIRIIMEASGHRNSTGDSDGGAISTVELVSATSTGSGVISNPLPLSLQSARVGVYI